MRKFLTADQFRQAAKENQAATADIALRKQFVAEVKAEADDSRVLTFTISTDSIDRDGDIISIEGWDLENFRKNPVMLWAHDYRSLPLGRSLGEWKEGGRLKSRVEFTPAGMTRFNDTVFDMYKGGFMSAVSVGFLPKKWAWAEDDNRRLGIDFQEQELLEFSAVPVPANPEALVEARSMGIEMDPLREWAREVLGANAASGIETIRGLEKGGLCVLRLSGPASQESIASIQRALAPFKEKHGVDFMVLDHTLALVGADADFIDRREIDGPAVDKLAREIAARHRQIEIERVRF